MKIGLVSSAPVGNYTGNKRATQKLSAQTFEGSINIPKLKNFTQQFVFLGPPGCGKGTQTGRFAELLGLPHIDTGSLLRAEIAAQTEDGKIAKSFIDKGQLVPENVVVKIIRNMLASPKCKDGYILDGFPRNLVQGKLLEQMNREIFVGENNIFKAIYFEINPRTLLERIIHRQSCPKCGEIYNKKFKPSKIVNECDTCHVPLKTRADDNAEVAESRFATYYEQTAPLIDFYEAKGVLEKLDASGSIEEVWNNLFNIVRKIV